MAVTVPSGITEIIPDETPEIPNADTTWYSKGYITIVPITPDYTAGTANPFPLK
jgi:5'-nucleotidase